MSFSEELYVLIMANRRESMAGELQTIEEFIGKVEALHQKYLRIEQAPKADAWETKQMHAECPECEDCVESAITHAKVTGSTGGRYESTQVVSAPSFRPLLAHWGEARRER